MDLSELVTERLNSRIWLCLADSSCILCGGKGGKEYETTGWEYCNCVIKNVSKEIISDLIKEYESEYGEYYA